MNPFKKFSKWRRRRRRDQVAAVDSVAPLREFVYIDEVSVNSLLSSRTGAIISEYTDKETLSSSNQIGGSIGTSAHVVNAQLQSQIQTAQAIESQIVRKSIIQSTFRELRDLESESLVLRAPKPDSISQRIDSVDRLLELLNETPPVGITKASTIKRGDLIEIDVALQTEPLFQLSTIISSVVDMLNGSSRFAQFASKESVDDVDAMGQLLDRLMVGLIPLRGKAVHYVVVEAASSEWIVHRDLLKDLPQGSYESRDLMVVGVVEANLFWKDVRRVLFSNSQYTMMCRSNIQGLSPSWTPIKLRDVLRESMPELALPLDTMLDNFTLSGLSGSTANTPPALALADQRTDAFHDALVSFALKLGEHYGTSIEERTLTEAGIPTSAQAGSHAGFDEQRKAFAAIEEHLTQAYGINPEPEVSVALRSEALAEVGFTDGGTQLQTVTPGPTNLGTTAERPRGSYLDTEIVAIYW